MSNACENSITIHGLTSEEQSQMADAAKGSKVFQTFIPNEETDNNWDTETDEFDNEVVVTDEGNVEFSFFSANHPPVEGIRNLSRKFPNATFSLTFTEESNDFFGALVSQNGVLSGVGINEEVSYKGTKYDWVRANHPELLDGLDNEDDVDYFLTTDFLDCDEVDGWESHLETIRQEMLTNSLSEVRQQPVSA